MNAIKKIASVLTVFCLAASITIPAIATNYMPVMVTDKYGNTYSVESIANGEIAEFDPDVNGPITVTNEYGDKYEIGSGDLAVKYNGIAINFPDAQPFIDGNNRTLIPLRFVAETMGANVSWYQEARTAVIEQNGITISVPIGSDTISVTENGNTTNVKMDTEAIIQEERTYVPIRYVAEALGAWVGYSDLFTTVQIYRDVLTPEEINRLHDYPDMSWEEYCEVNGYNDTDTNGDWAASYPHILYFTGTYGFENANEWKLQNPNGIETLKYTWETPTTYTGSFSDDTFTFGVQPNIDFAKLVIDEAIDGIQDEINIKNKISVALRTDLSCVYWSRHSNMSSAYLRGVLTVKIPDNADIDDIENNYDFISSPKAGETRNVDVEIVVNTFSQYVHWHSITALS